MNNKTAKKLRRQSEYLAVQVQLAGELQGKVLKHGPATANRIYKDLKSGKLR